MKANRFLFAALMTFILLVSPALLAAEENYLSFKTEDESNNIEIFKKAGPSVVFVTNKATRQDYFSLNVYEIPQGTGTGIIWDKSGIIVTNYHVVQNASRISITLYDHSTVNAKVLGIAPEKDIAVLKIDTDVNLHALPLGNSSLLEVGRKVLAIGNPFGLDTTLTVGVVSALGREIDTFYERKVKGVIQTDAAINPGNSGGPLLNSMGQLVGINTAIYGPNGGNVGIGFAIPINTVKKIVPQLIKHGKIMRPVIGIEAASDNWARRYNIKGVIIMQTVQGMPAERAGLLGMRYDRSGRIVLGDIITKIEDMEISNNDDLMTSLENRRPGDWVKVTTKRDGRTRVFNVQLARPY